MMLRQEDQCHTLVTLHLDNRTMSKLFYITKRTYKHGLRGEINEGASQTVTGEAYTIKELMDRYRNGMPLPHSNYAYFDQEDLDQINRFFNPGSLDLTDLDELNNNVSMLQKSVQEAIERRKEAEPVDTPPVPPIVNSDEDTEE